MVSELILGTAGHIDHGKTALVRALTGVDTDRLPEEKRRGITIDLGFAEWSCGDYRLGIVDVPGHERFIRNMLAGATGMDLALLVVAADDSVKPQTREHLDVLQLLQLSAGVIALTKCDLADPDWMDLVENEVRELVAPTFLAAAPIVRTSVITGEGLPALRAALCAAAERAAQSERRRHIDRSFRLAIDRVFTLPGHGTVVTGSVGSGRVSVGGQLRVEPGGIDVRVRGLHHHDRTVDEVHRGQRAAINLAGVHHEQLRRGHELCTPGHLVPSRWLTCQVHCLSGAPRPLKNRARVRIHLGTADIMARVLLVGRETSLVPGETSIVQLYLRESAVATWGQPLILRSESPVVTIGGGTVLFPAGDRLRRVDDEVLGYLGDLAAVEPLRRAGAAIFFLGTNPWEPADLERLASIDNPAALFGQLVEAGTLIEIPLSATRRTWCHRAVIGRIAERIVRALRAEHIRQPLRSAVDLPPFLRRVEYLAPAPVIQIGLQQLASQSRIRRSDRTIGLTDHGPQLTANEAKILDWIIRTYKEAGLQPPTVKECRDQAPRNQQQVEPLIQLAVSDGHLIKVANDYYLHVETEQRVRNLLTGHLQQSGGLTVSQIREILQVSRKYAVPLCEYFDRIRFTRREGDLRVLLPEPLTS